ncbi:MAG: adenylate/guanylate cyclase domain-containing protein [bacterium]|nr:adenylate/guanylate cyclase domain-containing protein [bacterium]
MARVDLRQGEAMTQRAPGILLGIGAIVLCLGLRAAGLFGGLEMAIHDRFVGSLHGDVVDEAPVLLVPIGESEFERFGYPLPDAVLAQAIERLREAGATAVGIDLYRDGPAGPSATELAGWAALEGVIAGDDGVVVSELLGSDDQRGIAAPAFASPAQVGFNNLLLDPGRVVRRGYLFAWDEDGTAHTSLSLQLALRHLARQGIHLGPDDTNADWVRLGDTVVPALESDFGAYTRLDAGGYQFPLDYARADAAIRPLAFTSLFDEPLPTDRVAGRIAIIGTDAPSVKDDFNAPHAPGEAVKGFRIHAHVTEQLIRMGEGEAVPRGSWSEVAELAWITGWGAAGIGLSLLLGSLGWAVPAFVAGLAVLVGVGAWLFAAGVWVPTVAPAFAWVVGGGLAVGDRARREARDQRELTMMFRRFTSRRVADWMWDRRDEFLEGGRFKARRGVITALLSDLKGYTAAAEKMEPSELIEWIDTYMSAMTEVIERYDKGHVDDYVGDGIKANFGVPVLSETEEEIAADAVAAVRCALEMGRTLERLNEGWAKAGWPVGRQRIGLFTGPAVVGSLGGEERQKYTSVGDTINTAARLEGIGGALDFDQETALQRILIGQRTRELIGDGFEVEDLGRHAVKGKDEPLQIYRVHGERAGSAEEDRT